MAYVDHPSGPHPFDEDPEEHIGEPVPDPWDDDERGDEERTQSFTPLFERIADPADERMRGFRWLE